MWHALTVVWPEYGDQIESGLHLRNRPLVDGHPSHAVNTRTATHSDPSGGPLIHGHPYPVCEAVGGSSDAPTTTAAASTNQTNPSNYHCLQLRSVYEYRI